MGQLPIGVGNHQEQQRFIQAHKDFLLEHPKLHTLLQKVSLRALVPPSQDELDRMARLPEGDPVAIAFEDKNLADNVVFGLGRIIADDFGELIVLAGNGYGIGAQKILRGLYERLVTAIFIAQNPSEARPFAEDDSVKKWKLWQQALEVMPDLKNSIPAERLQALEDEYKRVRAKRSESICNKCGQPKTQEAWTRVDLASMAKKADGDLAALYGACYLFPTFHSHATGFGLGARFRPSERGTISYQESSPAEANDALIQAHTLIIRHLVLQNEYFNLGLKSEIQARIEAFGRIWKKA